MIVLKKIDMTLDPASIENAIREVELFEKQLKPAMQCLIDYLGEKGVEIARAQLLWVDGSDFIGETSGKLYISERPVYDSGDLSRSIRYGKNENGECAVIAGEGLHNAMGDPDSPSYAMYVEYGNMSAGRKNGRRGGWWYPAPYGWRYWH